MEKEITLYHRTLKEKDKPNYLIDQFNLYQDSNFKRAILASNPFKESDDDVFQILCVYNNIIVGTEIHYPITLLINSQKYKSVTGHSLYVNPNYRGQGIGSKITDYRLNYSKSNSLLLCNASQMQIPILKRLGAHIFYMHRLILLHRSYSVIENKTNKISAKLLSPIIDNILKLQFKILLRNKRKLLKKGFHLKKVNIIPKEIENILNADKHPFKEFHDVDWFQWIMKNSLINNDNGNKSFYIIYNEDRPVAFFMTKQRFYEKASHRGFKNLTLGSVLEWASIDENLISNNEVALLAITSFDKNVDAVELCCDTEEMSSYFKSRGLVQVGNGNVVFRYRPNSVFSTIKDIGEQNKWRLRPAMGDNALS